ncbi:MAG: UvrD-helicase domain-containing protein [Cognatishimia activa]|uniref:UvrD-helicase domain-containing protein n=2 Tax=unclassified Sulfitobacter TaxID=196795 RepID=UPI0037459303
MDIAGRLEQEVFSKLNQEAIGSTRFGEIETIRNFLSAPETQRQAAIERYVASQLELWSDFFDSFESNPLTPEQRLSIIVDEDATLVLAGAGSGKTSVITAKAGYLIKVGLRKPHEVLLLAFARDAAAEMSERIKDRCGEPVEARTFHALAYDIIGQVEGGKPALAAHATDDKAFLALIRDILVELALKVSEASKAILGWFTSARLEAKSEWDFQRKHDFYTYLEKEDLRTLQGEKVKSYEELLIANWLYENGVEYEYEPDYEVDTSSPTRRNYCPDFRLTESGVYLEHFGVRKQSGQGGQEVLVTAPWVDRDEYLEGMAWKRQVHQENGTILLETYSYENSEGRLLDALAEKIAPFVTLKPRPREELFDRVMQMNQVDGFVQLLGNFLRNFKSGGYAYEDCERKAQSAKLGKRAAAFLSVFRPVYEAYQDRLGTRIDFEDMVLRAANYVETGQYKSPFRHILVDEFQDISRSRARLVKGLLGQHSDARLFAVGDDWQSIYRFAGSDIHLMRNFGEEFGGTFNGKSGVHRTVDLGRTFRSVDKIAFAARHFVLQNPTQLEKIVIPAGTTEEAAIRIVSTFRHDGEEKLRGVLSELQLRAEADGRQGTVLMLGRYRHSMPEQMRDLRRSFPDLDITFKTIHASKGLEADHVVLLDMFSGRMGFPSEIVDDPLLTMVSPEGEPFPHAEERRVMYVAMTRARKTLTLMGAASRQSTFIAELVDDDAYGLGADKTEDLPTCTCGDCGGHLFAVPRKDGGTFYRCEHVELCGNTLPSCPDCGVGIPVRSEDGRSSDCRCGATFQACPVCADGWLVERSGRYGRFLGCVKFPRCNGKGRL